MSNNNIVISKSENFIHVKSEAIPDWVKKLDILKEKIHSALENPDKKIDGVVFCKPFDVPNSQNA